jgi:RHS repeat-associated protein
VDNTGVAGRVPHMVLTYGYDATGNRTSLTDSLGGTATYTYDPDNRLGSLSLQVKGKGPLVTLSYDLGGRLTYEQRSTPGVAGSVEIDTQLGYSVTDLVTTITHSVNGGSSLSSFSYGYDSAARLTSSTGPEGTLAYTNDSIGELTRVTGARTETYTYDAQGNRTSANGQTYGAPGPGNRLTTDGVYSYGYDAEGNLTTKTLLSDSTKVTTYTWDYRNRLTEVQTPTAQDDTFIYDIFDRRIGKSVNGGTTRWTAYDGANPYADFNGTSLSNRYLYGDPLDQLFARVDTSGNTTAWYLGDNLGSIRQLISNSGTVLDNVTYGDSYGNNPSDSGTGDRFKFTAREYDTEIGLYYVRARYYDANVGRFLSQDPLGFGAGDANLYRYVGNGPTNDTDALGLQRPGQPPNPAPAPNPGTAPPGQPANPTTGSNNAQQQQQQLRGNIRTRNDLCRQNASLTAQLNGLQAQIDRLIEMGGDPDVINALVNQSISIQAQIDRNQLAINRANYAIGYRYREDIR